MKTKKAYENIGENTSKKEQIVLAVMAGEKNINEAAQEYNVASQEIESWREMYVAGLRKQRVRRKIIATLFATKRKRLITILAASILVLGISGVVVAQTTSICADHDEIICFQENSPAKASDVNNNFAKLYGWLKQKVGEVGNSNISTSGSITSTAGTVKGTQVVSTGSITATEGTGLIKGKNLEVTGSITSTSGTVKGTQVVSAGNITATEGTGIIKAKTIEATEKIIGSNFMLSDKSKISIIEAGTVDVTPGDGTIAGCGSSTAQQGRVTFVSPFTSRPVVVLTVDESLSGNGGTHARIQDLDSTGFSWVSFVPAKNGSVDNCAVEYVHWIAIGK